jgi:hypothetical protein
MYDSVRQNPTFKRISDLVFGDAWGREAAGLETRPPLANSFRLKAEATGRLRASARSSDHTAPIAANLLDRDFTARTPVETRRRAIQETL